MTTRWTIQSFKDNTPFGVDAEAATPTLARKPMLAAIAALAANLGLPVPPAPSLRALSGEGGSFYYIDLVGSGNNRKSYVYILAVKI